MPSLRNENNEIANVLLQTKHLVDVNVRISAHFKNHNNWVYD